MYGSLIGGALGWILGGPIGALAGFAIGAIFDAATDKQTGQQAWNSTQDSQVDFEARNGFLFSLLVLCAHVIQADGKIMHSEMELVRQFLRQNFGDAAAKQGNDILLRLFDYRKQKGDMLWKGQMRQVYQQMADNMTEEQRLQLLGFMVELAKADGKTTKEEIDALREVAAGLRLDAGAVDQMFAMGGTTLEDAYAVFGLSPSATDDEVRKTYKKLMLQYHPDRVASLGEDIREAANQKAQEINEAKEIIYKSRGM